jgi:uncharacterized membrane protein YjjP (DUF1212 family)
MERPNLNNENISETGSSSDEKRSAIEDILRIRSEVAVQGFNDSEIPELNSLVSLVESEDLAPEEALKRAYEIQSSKQDYH